MVDSQTLQLIFRAINDMADDDGWADLSRVGNHLTAIKPDFDTRTYGRAKLSGLLQGLDVFDIKQKDSQKYVRKKPSFLPFLKAVQQVIESDYQAGQWIGLGILASGIVQRYPDLDVTAYGHTTIKEALLHIHSKCFEFNADKTQLKLVTKTAQ